MCINLCKGRAAPGTTFPVRLSCLAPYQAPAGLGFRGETAFARRRATTDKKCGVSTRNGRSKAASASMFPKGRSPTHASHTPQQPEAEFSGVSGVTEWHRGSRPVQQQT